MAQPATHLPTIKQLRYFVALVEEQHFGRAASRCFVSQSAFSVAIQELEALLDVSLVDRTNRKVTITPTGREIAVLAKLCLQDLGTLVETARSQSRPLEGPLHLGVIPTIAPFLMPRVLPALREEYPELKPYLHEEITQRLHEQLMEGTLDLILVALPYDLPGTEQMELFRDDFRLAARAGSKLVVDPEHHSLENLDAGSVLLLREGHCLREHALEACKLRNSDSLSSFSASSLLTLVEMVDADLGVTYLPEMAVDSALLQRTQVRTWPLPESRYRTIGLVWRRGSARESEFRMLGEFIRGHRAD